MTGFIVAAVVLYFALLAFSIRYSRQNSQPAERLVAELVDSPLVDARLNRLADAVCAPREEVRDAEAQ